MELIKTRRDYQHQSILLFDDQQEEEARIVYQNGITSTSPRWGEVSFTSQALTELKGSFS